MVVSRAVGAVARELCIHPVRDWLDTLTWDGTPRIETWTSTYLGAEPTAFNHTIGALWLISAVARICRPGVKADHMLILEGPRGARKSTAIKVLAGEEWFTDEPPELGSKDAALHMQGVWIVEIADLGRVDEVLQPQADRGEVDEAEEAGGGLVVARGDASGVLQAIEAPLDPVAQRVDVAVDGLADAPALPGGDHGHAATRLDVLADGVGVAAAIGEQNPHRRPVGGHERAIPFAVRHFAAGDLSGYGQAGAVRPEVDLGRQATARAPETLALHPPLAPAAD